MRFRSRSGLAKAAWTTDVEALAPLRNLDRLRLLDPSACHCITDDLLAHISGCGGLVALNHSTTWVSDAGLAHLSGLVRLTELMMDECIHIVDDAGYAHLAKQVRLHTLGLCHTQFGVAAIAHLSGLRDLRELRTGGRMADGVSWHVYGVGDAELAALCGLSA